MLDNHHYAEDNSHCIFGLQMVMKMEMPPIVRIMDAYDQRTISGPQSLEAISDHLGLEGRRLSRPLFILGFEKRYEPDGKVFYLPPRSGRSRRLQWPERQIAYRMLLARGDKPAHANNILGRWGADVVRQALDGAGKNSEESSYSLVSRKDAEIRELNMKHAEEVITVAELAEILRESPNMPKEALLNRARGLVKAATRKGNWEDFRNTISTPKGAD